MPFLLLYFLITFSTFSHAADIEPEILTRFNQGETQDLIVEYDDASVNKSLIATRLNKRLKTDNDDVLAIKRKAYASLKSQMKTLELQQGIQAVKDYPYLPLSLKRFKSLSSLKTFMTNGNIKAVYVDRIMHKVLTQSLPLINQPVVSQVNYKGAGATVVVIDDGIDFTKSAFGPCTAVATPSATCRVVVANTIVNSGTANASPNHGSNVAATVLGVAPEAKIAAINVFNNSGGAYTSDILSAINWAVANRSTYNIVAINMSLGASDKNTSPCQSNPFTSPIQRAKDAGINVVVAAGNDGYLDGISTPACAPAAISVGAVYDSNVGGLAYSNCTDSTSGADKVTCFSNSANYLTLLAPGALITAAGITMAGTSQASPHVAGAVAVLRSAFVNETADQIQARLTSFGNPVTDSRNSLVKPRLDLSAAARPQNDSFSNPALMSGDSGSVSGTNLLATAEVSEPAHADLAAQNTVWLQWTAPASGQVTLIVNGSVANPRLAVYTGTAISALTPKAAIDNANSPLYFQASANTQYHIALNTNQTDAGSYQLSWQLNTQANANLSVTFSGPNQQLALATPYLYTLTVANGGPSNATNVAVQLSLPTGADLVSADQRCQLQGRTLTCRVAQLNVGSSSSFNVQLSWTNTQDVPPLVISVNSDLADADTGNNSTTFSLPATQASTVTDVPTLPEWGLILLACMLIFLNRRNLQRV